MEMRGLRAPHAWQSALPGISGGVGVVLGILVMAEWYLGNGLLHGLGFGDAPLRFNVGLGFAVCGAGLIFRDIGWRRMADAAAVAATVGAVLTAVQFPLGVDLGIDQAFVEHPMVPGNPFPGRMAPGTAVCFALSGLSLLLGPRVPVAARSFGGSVLALASVALLGQAYHFRSIVAGIVPMPAAIGFVVLGAGFVSVAWQGSPMRRKVSARYAPYATGLVGLLAAVLFWQSLVAHQRAQVQRMVEMTAVGALAEVGTLVRSVTRSLEHVAGECESAGRPSVAEWHDQARLLLERLGGPKAVEWIDDNFTVAHRVVAGEAEGVSAQLLRIPDAALEIDAASREALEAARAAKTPAATPTFAYGEGQRAFRIVVPLFQRGTFDGFVSAFFVVDEVLDLTFAERSRDYALAVFEGDRRIYGPQVDRTGPACVFCRFYTLDLPGGRSWKLWVNPSPELLATVYTSFPELILASGILIALLLTAMLRLLERVTHTAHDLEAANRMLGEEIAIRRSAEEGIRKLAADLEDRVRVRTAELATANAALRSENVLRQRAQATLERTNAGLRQFASFISHELRQPLATMAIWAELLEEHPEVDLGKRGRDYVTRLRAAIDRMTSFLESQLRLARVTYTQPSFAEDVDVAALIREVAGDFAHQLQQVGGVVEVQDVPVVRADGSQMRQLFRNLIENAVKYRRPDVPLVVRIDGRVVPETEGGPLCEIRVSDNGQGFTPDDAEHIFEIFRRLKDRKVGGSGVGLAICRRIVEHHGGSIRAQGKPGVGTTFVIELPIDRGGGGAVSPVRAADASPF